MIIEPPQPKFKILKGNLKNVLRRVLFISGTKIEHSKCAAAIFSRITNGKSKVEFASIFDENRITPQQITWADTIFVMEDWISLYLIERFYKKAKAKSIFNLSLYSLSAIKKDLGFEVFNLIYVVNKIELKMRKGGKYYTLEECVKMLK